MFIVLTLWMMGFVFGVWGKLCALAVGMSIMWHKGTGSMVLKLCLLGLVFIGVQYVQLPDFGHYRVIMIRNSAVIVRAGLNTYRINDDNSWDLDGVYAISGEIDYYQSRSHYQMQNRELGSIRVDTVTKVKDARWFHNFLSWRYAKYPDILAFFYHDSSLVFGSLGLHMAGLSACVYVLSRKWLSHKHRNYLNCALLGLYGWGFGFNLNVLRLLLGRTHLKKEHQMLCLLLMFPYAQFHLGFMVSFLPLCLTGMFGEVEHHYLQIARTFLVHTIMGSVHCLQIILYKLWVGLFAGVWLALLCQLNTIASGLLAMSDIFLTHTQRFEFRGGLSVLTFIGAIYLCRKTKSLLVVYLLLVVFMTYYPFPRVRFVDVGQGDATIISSAWNAHVTMIDTGRVFALSSVESALKAMGIRRIDQLIITHGDIDHNENEAYIIKHYRVKHHITQKQTPTVFLTELLPGNEYDDENENSLIYYLKANKLSFLFMGDAGHNQEAELLKQHPQLHVDFLKLGHHGSKTGTSASFIRSIQPQYAIASSHPLIYNHPHPDVRRLCYQHRIALLMTYDLGDITIHMTPFGNFMVSEGKRFGIIGYR